jgi:hypothetical protein
LMSSGFLISIAFMSPKGPVGLYLRSIIAYPTL